MKMNANIMSRNADAIYERNEQLAELCRLNINFMMSSRSPSRS